ncbi:MAG: hypothetical protein IPN14_03855 [Bacteroidetes bacterium]|nr:hypothetical protein [Bacteroidota bacterium]
MTNQTKFVSQEEMKDKIKKYFLEPIEDRFTQVSTIKCKRKITIKLTTKLTIDFRKKGSVGLVFFRFDNENTTDWLGMNRLKLYLIIDSKIRIELNDISGQDFNSSLHKDTSNKHYTKYYETAQLSLPPSDYKIIANANTIEYSLRFDKADYEGYFTKNELNIF